MKELEKLSAKEKWRLYQSEESSSYTYEKAIERFIKFHNFPDWDSFLELDNQEITERAY